MKNDWNGGKTTKRWTTFYKQFLVPYSYPGSNMPQGEQRSLTETYSLLWFHLSSCDQGPVADIFHLSYINVQSDTITPYMKKKAFSTTKELLVGEYPT